MWQAIGAAVAGNLIGGVLQRDANRQANYEDRVQSDRINAENIALQKEFAKNGVRWKVEDAIAAGISPLAALGAQTSSFSPISVGTSSTPDPMGSYVAQMGQDVSRAISSTRTADERMAATLALQGAKLDIEGKALDNQIRASQLQKMNAVGPSMPSASGSGGVIDGQGNSVMVKPSEVYASEGSRPGIQSGMINSLQYTREANGNISIAPSSDMKERMEDDFIAENLWHIKNRILPPAPDTRDYPIPPDLYRQGYRFWFWNPMKQEFVPSKNP